MANKRTKLQLTKNFKIKTLNPSWEPSPAEVKNKVQAKKLKNLKYLKYNSGSIVMLLFKKNTLRKGV